jgi:hypothetical protein
MDSVRRLIKLMMKGRKILHWKMKIQIINLQKLMESLAWLPI